MERTRGKKKRKQKEEEEDNRKREEEIGTDNRKYGTGREIRKSEQKKVTEANISNNKRREQGSNSKYTYHVKGAELENMVKEQSKKEKQRTK